MTCLNNWKWLGISTFHLASAFGMAGVLASTPDPSGEVALVYSPFATPADALDRAASTGGRIVRVGSAPFLVVVAPPPEAHDFATRARASGAWLQLNPIVARGCAPPRIREVS